MSEPDGLENSPWPKAEDWSELCHSIHDGRCTPFIGSGACFGVLPDGKILAKRLAEWCNYPGADHQNLARVAQYVAVTSGPIVAPEMVKQFLEEDLLRNAGSFRDESDNGWRLFDDPNEPHRMLADLRLKMYLTTNYDDLMERALRRPGGDQQKVERQVCRWRMDAYDGEVVQAEELLQYVQDRRSEQANFEPSSDLPLVYHLHGDLHQPRSMVLTEDDYLEFLVTTSQGPTDRSREKNAPILPAKVQSVFTYNALLFMGYGLEDVDFQVLFQRLSAQGAGNMSRRFNAHVAVQLSPQHGLTKAEEIERATRLEDYIRKRFQLKQISLYPGSCRDFARDLRYRYEQFRARNAGKA